MLAHNFAQHVPRAVDQRTLFGDVNLLLPSFHLRQIEVRSGIKPHIHNHILCNRVEVGSLRQNYVPARRQLGQNITSIEAGNRVAADPCSRVFGRHLGARHHAAARIDHVTANRTPVALRRSQPGQAKQHHDSA